MRFPIFKTKIKGLNQKPSIKAKPGARFNLTNPKEREKYFELKAGPEIKKLKEYLKKNTFVAYLLGKKNSGKGTYAKMFAEAVSLKKIDHFSIGDMIRDIDEDLRDRERKKELITFLEKNYRGFSPLKDIISALEKIQPKKTILTHISSEDETGITALIKKNKDRFSIIAAFDGFIETFN